MPSSQGHLLEVERMALDALNLKSALAQAPTYLDIVSRNSIDVLAKGLDLAFENGDLALTRRGDLMLGSDDTHAFFDLVRDWHYNFPALTIAFDLMVEAQDCRLELEVERESLCKDATLESKRFQDNFDGVAMMEFAKCCYASLVVVNLSNALQTFKSDIGAARDEWTTATPQYNGRSFGEILEASANNVRHRDEWAATSPPTPQQLKSIEVLADALDEPVAATGTKHRFAREISPETLALVSGQDFSRLEANFFAYAKSLYELRARRLPA